LSFLTAEPQSSQRRTFFLWRQEAAREKPFALYLKNDVSLVKLVLWSFRYGLGDNVQDIVY